MQLRSLLSCFMCRLHHHHHHHPTSMWFFSSFIVFLLLYLSSLNMCFPLAMCLSFVRIYYSLFVISLWSYWMVNLIPKRHNFYFLSFRIPLIFIIRFSQIFSTCCCFPFDIHSHIEANLQQQPKNVNLLFVFYVLCISNHRL